MSTIGHNGLNSTQSNELRQRAGLIFGKMQTQAAIKRRAREMTAEIADHFKDAEAVGFDKKVLRAAIKRAMANEEQRDQLDLFEQQVSLYADAIGDIEEARADTPLLDVTVTMAPAGQ